MMSIVDIARPAPFTAKRHHMSKRAAMIQSEFLTETSHAAVQPDVVEVRLRRDDVTRVFLGPITQRVDVFLSELGVVVEVDLAVHAVHYTEHNHLTMTSSFHEEWCGTWRTCSVSVLRHGVDLDHGRVVLHENIVQLLDDVDCLSSKYT